MSDVCEWYGQSGEIEGTYEANCQEAFVVIDGTVAENKFKYCPYCGGELDVYEADYSDL